MSWSLSPFGAYNSARKLIFSLIAGTENEDLTVLLSKEKEQKKVDEERIKELHNSLQDKVSENERLQRSLAILINQIVTARITKAKLKEEMVKNEGLQQQVERDVKSNADRVSEYEQQIKKLKDEMDELRENMEKRIQLIQREAAEREEILQRKVEEPGGKRTRRDVKEEKDGDIWMREMVLAPKEDSKEKKSFPFLHFLPYKKMK
ncbi:Nuclear pore complex protein NUP62 [Dissostichus eleginoides]|uniref:Nuclear pore complex protein NUP62 n=1 Tax=Dissostichus eleginoides TaxID=100907 RepID=A0AAD9CBF3_DISEL|nr:Nuclear pore complex protein NUP62 [Dissostichus eleginoides]